MLAQGYVKIIYGVPALCDHVGEKMTLGNGGFAFFNPAKNSQKPIEFVAGNSIIETGG